MSKVEVVLIEAGAREHGTFTIQGRMPRTRTALGAVRWPDPMHFPDGRIRIDRFSLARTLEGRHYVLWCERQDRDVCLPPVPVAVCARKGCSPNAAAEWLLGAFYLDARERDMIAALPWYDCEPETLPLKSWLFLNAHVWPYGPISDLVLGSDDRFSKAMINVLRRRCLEEFRRTGDVRGNLGPIVDLLDAEQAATAAVFWPVEDGDFNPEDLNGVVSARRLEALYEGAPPSDWELARWRTIAKAQRGEREQFHWAELLRIADGETGEIFVINHHDAYGPLAITGPYATVRAARRALVRDYEVELLDAAWN